MLLTKRFIAVALVGLVAVTGRTIHPVAAEDSKQTTVAAQPANALPPEIQQALEVNAKQLSPITLSYTMQFKSDVSLDETAKRMKLPAGERSLFSKMTCRTVWQGHSFYHSMKQEVQGADAGIRSLDMEMAYMGDVQLRVFRPQGSGAGGAATLMKMRVNKSMPLDQELFIFYLGSAVSLSLQWDPGDVVQLRMESEILNALTKGMLRSVEPVVLEGRPHVRLTLETENVVRKRADAAALQYEAMSRQSPLPPEVQEQQKQFLQNIEEQRKTPPVRRVIFDLDPELHYAVRQVEHWYDPDICLRRTTCSEFKQVAGRSLWLPHRCETQWHEFLSTPTVSKDVLLTQVFEVDESNADPVPDQLFALNSTTPGTLIQDGTLSDGPNSPRRMVTYVVPERPEDLEKVIDEARKKADSLQLIPPNGPAAAATANPQRGMPPVIESGSVETSDRPRLLWMLLALNGVLLAGAAAFVFLKKKRRP